MAEPTTADALREIASVVYELRNAVELSTFERLMHIRSELTALAAKEDEFETPFQFGAETDDSEADRTTDT